MEPTLDLSIIIPTYNEQDIIEKALVEIQAALPESLLSKTEVIIADDGTDGLPGVVQSCQSKLKFSNIRVQRNNPPLGKGKSLTHAFSIALGRIVGFLDVDLSTHPRYIPGAFQILDEDRADIFIASRRAPGAHLNREQSLAKDILGNILIVVARHSLFAGMRFYPDTQCGFKFFKSKWIPALYSDLVAPDGLNDLEVLLRANFINLRVHEQGVVWIDLRESKRALSRIFWGEVKALALIFLTYRFFNSKLKKRFLNLRKNDT